MNKNSDSVQPKRIFHEARKDFFSSSLKLKNNRLKLFNPRISFPKISFEYFDIGEDKIDCQEIIDNINRNRKNLNMNQNNSTENKKPIVSSVNSITTSTTNKTKK